MAAVRMTVEAERAQTKATLIKRLIDYPAYLRIRDVDEARDVLPVVVKNLAVRVENIHGATSLERMVSTIQNTL